MLDLISSKCICYSEWILMENERYHKGLEIMAELDPEATEKLQNEMGNLCPDMTRYVLEFAYGDIWARTSLDLRTREIITIAALATMGTAAPELRKHIKKALHIGITKEELSEIMLHIVVYAGFPAGINGVQAIEDVVKQLESSSE
jgi:4-carboxymuconolactone decarboxylase